MSGATVTPEGGAPSRGDVEAGARERRSASLTPSRPRSPRASARCTSSTTRRSGAGRRGSTRSPRRARATRSRSSRPIAARIAFPCFDEPGFKMPVHDDASSSPPAMQAIAQHARGLARARRGRQRVRVRFAPTLPLPSYLVAFAVGPLDVVAAPTSRRTPCARARSRCAAWPPRGRGKEIAYALAHTGEILAVLESYFGIEYPYDKLDILAVPGKGGAMENAGAITFGERLVLFDETTAPARAAPRLRVRHGARARAPVVRRPRDDAVVGRHLAQRGVRDLDRRRRPSTAWDPKLDARTSTLLGGVQGAMGADASSARAPIRQPIASTHDIENAFDTITYQKGGGVLGMFERWVGADTFRSGLHALPRGRTASATRRPTTSSTPRVAASGKDVKTRVPHLPRSAGRAVRRGRRALRRRRAARCTSSSRATSRSARRAIATKTLADPGLRALRGPARSEGGVHAPHRHGRRTSRSARGRARLGSSPTPTRPATSASRSPRADLAKLRDEGCRDALGAREASPTRTACAPPSTAARLPMKDVIDAAAPLADDAAPRRRRASRWASSSTPRDWLYDDPLRAARRALRRASSTRRRSGSSAGSRREGEDDETHAAARVGRLGFLAFDRARPGGARRGEEARPRVPRLSARTARSTRTRSTRTSPATASPSSARRRTARSGTRCAPSSTKTDDASRARPPPLGARRRARPAARRGGASSRSTRRSAPTR